MDVLVFIICLLFTISFIIFIAKTLKGSYSNLPPGPRPLPLIGNLHQLGVAPHKSLAKLAQTHGSIMSLKLGQVTAIVISSASAARLVLQKQDISFANRSVPDSMRAYGHDEVSVVWRPLSSEWRELKRICISEIFSNQKMESCASLRQQKVDQLVRDVSQSASLGKPVQIGEAAFKTMLSLISSMFLSVDVTHGDTEAASEFKRSFASVMELGGIPNLVDFFPWLKWIDPQRIKARMTAHFEKILKLVGSKIDERMEERAEQGSVSETRDVLDTLVNILLGNKEGVSRKEIEHLIMELLIAGTDTTSSTVEWAMSEVLRSPQTLCRAKAELEQVSGKGVAIREKDLAYMPYLQAIIKETMRLHPVVPFLVPRTTLDQVELSSFTIPRGARIMINAWAIGRDPSTWDNPECFEPERFLGSDVDFRGQNFELIPFGGGRRMCPGISLGFKMAALILGSLVNSFDWKLEGGMKTEDIDMDEKFGLSVQKIHPLCAIPVNI
ncbi:unnamed protein product [Rhodiola kirilowii]